MSGRTATLDPDITAFIDRLCNDFPAIVRIRSKHLRDNGELLPHLFLGDVARHAISLFDTKTKSAEQELLMLSGFMEREFVAGTRPVRDLIALGFLENLAGPPEPHWHVRTVLGPELRRAIEEMWPVTE